MVTVVAMAGILLAGAGVLLARQSLALGEAEFLARDPKLTTREVTSRDVEPVRHDFATYRGGPGVAEIALAIEKAAAPERASRAATRDKARRVAAAARDVIAGAPLSSEGWCALSEAMLMVEGPTATVQRALDACYATGPRSIAALMPRARVSLLMWEALSENARERALTDIAAGLLDRSVSPWVVEELARIAAAASPELSERAAALVSSHASASRSRFDEVFQQERMRLGRT